MAYCSDTPTRCTGGQEPGTSALMTYALSHFTGSNWGIYNCRNVRGGSTLSLHGEGRAGDFGTVTVTDSGRALASFLVTHAEELGIQEVIYNRMIWSARNPTWHPYTGSNPHTDHVHFGQCRHFARTLTYAKIIIISGEDSMPDEKYFDTKFDRNARRVERLAGITSRRIRESEARIIKAVKFSDRDDVTLADLTAALADADAETVKKLVTGFEPVLREVLGEIHGESLDESAVNGIAAAVADELALRLAGVDN